MYIEFGLPKNVGERAVAFVNQQLNKNLHEWADKYGIAYNKKIHKYTVRITFDNDQHYSLFAMTWLPKYDYLLEYRFVEPMRRV